MKIYLDLIFLLNFYLDFLLLMVTNLVLKRNASIKRLLLGTLTGSLTLFVLFFPVSSFFLFLAKIFMAFVMNFVTFGFRDLKYLLNNVSYFYMISIILGGFLYYLNTEFPSQNQIMVCFFILISPVVLFIYFRQVKKFKSLYQLTYTVLIALKNEKFTLTGFLDTGNKLVDPITNKPILLIEKGIIDESQERFYYIPFNSLNNHNLVECFKPLYVVINEKKYKNYLIAISDKKFHLDGVQCLLNNSLLEE